MTREDTRMFMKKQNHTGTLRRWRRRSEPTATPGVGEGAASRATEIAVGRRWPDATQVSAWSTTAVTWGYGPAPSEFL